MQVSFPNLVNVKGFLNCFFVEYQEAQRLTATNEFHFPQENSPVSAVKFRRFLNLKHGSGTSIFRTTAKRANKSRSKRQKKYIAFVLCLQFTSFTSIITASELTKHYFNTETRQGVKYGNL